MGRRARNRPGWAKPSATKRDRVFNGLTVKRITQGEHKHGVFYALAPAKGGNQPDGTPSYRPDLLDFAEGNVGDVEGNVDDKRSPSLAPIDPITCEDLGNVGNVGNLIPSSREENSLSHTYTRTRESVRHANKESPENVPHVPHVPLKSATETKDSDFCQGNV